jgi:predicted nucleotidyltransferase
MRRDEALAISRAHAEELGDAFGVSSLSVFGSVVRDEARSESDVDVLVEFDRPVGSFCFIGVKQRLEEILGLGVDLVSRGSIKPQLRERILAEAIRAA